MRRHNVVIEEDALAKRFKMFGKTLGSVWSVALAVSGLVRGLDGQPSKRKSALGCRKSESPGVVDHTTKVQTPDECCPHLQRAAAVKGTKGGGVSLGTLPNVNSCLH